MGGLEKKNENDGALEYETVQPPPGISEVRFYFAFFSVYCAPIYAFFSHFDEVEPNSWVGGSGSGTERVGGGVGLCAKC